MKEQQETSRILVIGALPPPFAGTRVSFKLFCDFPDNQSGKISIKIINSSPDIGKAPAYTKICVRRAYQQAERNLRSIGNYEIT